MDATSDGRRELIGVLYLDSRAVTGKLSQTSLKLLESLAFEASKAFENVRLMHESQEKQKLEREFQTAREVQVALMPVNSVKSERFDLVAHSIPCRYVAGGFYDLIALQDGRVALTLADVSGKGISAALLAAGAQGGFEKQVSPGQLPAGGCRNPQPPVVDRSGGR